MYTVACMKWGDKYGPEYVNRLYNMVERNTTLPFKFICFTDNADGLLPEVSVRPLPDMPLPPDKERAGGSCRSFGTMWAWRGGCCFSTSML